MATEVTAEVLAVAFGVTGRAELDPAMEMLSDLLRRHCAGEVEEPAAWPTHPCAAEYGREGCRTGSANVIIGRLR